MQIDRTDDTVRVTLTAEEAEAVRDDLGQIWASKVSAAGDKLHSLLESVTDEETHVVADSSDDPERVDDCPGCPAATPAP
jgi:polyhydroxyalkanoate synthesis regulator phasin